MRKLLPESWGFLCPVHTPDGSPCGLLNHLSHTCNIVVNKSNVDGIAGLVASLGAGQMAGIGPRVKGGKAKSDEGYEGSSDEEMEDAEGGDASADEEVEMDLDTLTKQREETTVSIQLDGKIVGWGTAKLVERIARQLRHWKVMGLKGVPLDLEIGWVPPSNGGQYPGLFLFSTPARMTRPVKYLANEKTDMVGPFEQVYMDIACMNEDVVPGLTTHIEFTPTNILSVVANLTPFSDFNQSPRNMYQCQVS